MLFLSSMDLVVQYLLNYWWDCAEILHAVKMEAQQQQLGFSKSNFNTFKRLTCLEQRPDRLVLEKLHLHLLP